MAEVEKDKWRPSRLLQSISCTPTPRLSGLLCRASVLCCGSGLPAGRGYGAAGSRFEREVVELEETPWLVGKARGERSVMLTINGQENKYVYVTT